MFRSSCKMALFCIAAALPAGALAEGTDHDLVVGRWGVGWFGISDIPLATATTTGTADVFELTPGPDETVAAPAIGVRHWFSSRWGVDAALGLHVSGGKTVTRVGDSNETNPLKRRFGFLLHGGLPIAFATGQHIALVLTPELNFGHASASVETSDVAPEPPPKASLSGLMFNLGARAGGEVQFGFIGVPELALEASVGFFVLYEWTQSSANDKAFTRSSTRFSTSQINDPWDIFSASVAARYYF